MEPVKVDARSGVSIDSDSTVQPSISCTCRDRSVPASTSLRVTASMSATVVQNTYRAVPFAEYRVLAVISGAAIGFLLHLAPTGRRLDLLFGQHRLGLAGVVADADLARGQRAADVEVLGDLPARRPPVRDRRRGDLGLTD